MVLQDLPIEIKDHSFNVSVMQYVLPRWVRRVGGGSKEVVQVFNEIIGPLVGLWITNIGTVEKTQ